MITRRTLFILIAFVAVLFLAVCVAVFFLYRAMPPLPPKTGERVIVAQAKYIKGNASFFYPAQWRENDIPASPGLISVQVVDEEDGIVFVASSAEKMSDSKVNGTLVRDESIAVGAVAGKERRWENMESQVVVFRADDLQFEGKQYRFEMFGMMSRKVKMEGYWQEMLGSVRFEKGDEEGIKASPQQ